MNYEWIKLGAILRYGGISRHPLLRAVACGEKDAVAKRFCYSAKHNFTYVRIPKSANSTIVRTLISHMSERKPGRNRLLGRTRWKGSLRRLPSPAQFEASYSFSFIRDPASRVLSAYLNKARHRRFREKYGLQDPNNNGQTVSFSEFLERLETGLLDADLHWAPQTSILPFGGKGLKFMGRVENFDADIKHAMTEIFGHFKGVERRNTNVTHAGSRVGEYVDEYDRRRIERLYAEDYEFYFSLKR